MSSHFFFKLDVWSSLLTSSDKTTELSKTINPVVPGAGTYNFGLSEYGVV